MKHRLILKSFQSPGDIVMLSAAVRDLHAAHPGRFQTDVRTSADAIWENNPHLTRLEEHDPEVADSGIASILLKRKEIYPDSVEETDVILFEYNRQGEVTKSTDQNGTVHQFDYDALGRQTQDRATTLGIGVDGGVRRISSTYEVRGMRQKLTGYNSESVGSGSIVNEVQFAYNDFGQITKDYQAHGGAVNTSTSPKVQYGYADGSANTIRPTTITYPNGRVIAYDYDSANSIPDAASRIASIVDDDMASTHLADYSYLGLGTFVETDYTEPEIKWTMVGTAGGNDPDTGDIYRGFDRFARVKDNYWYDYNSSTDVDRIKYAYDRNGNRLYRENTVATANGKSFDELYDYDLIDRLKAMDRGDLDAMKDAITNKQFAQNWALDSTGNWRNFREDEDDAGWDLNQQRTSNRVNEITDVSELLGPSWVTPVYSKAGNMTTIAKPADPTAAFTATYDAWNGLVRIEEGANKVAEYEYDGAKRRTVKKTYASGVLDETRHFYYTEPSKWQVVEERVDTSSNADRQFIWGLRYVDDILLRDRDTNGGGTLNERLYGMQDANWNVTSISNASGSLQERFSYDPYGLSTALTPTFAYRGGSSFAWEVRYAGYRFDGESALYYVRHRLLHATLSWLQRDPVGYDRLNLYEYYHSDPLKSFDPLGLQIHAVQCHQQRIACMAPVLALLRWCIRNCVIGADIVVFVACVVIAMRICLMSGPITPGCMAIGAAICGALGIVVTFAVLAACAPQAMDDALKCTRDYYECMGNPNVLA